MNIDKRTTISLSAKEVQKILAEHLYSKGYKVKPTDIEMKIEEKFVGEVVGERPVIYRTHRFTEAVVIIKEEED